MESNARRRLILGLALGIAGLVFVGSGTVLAAGGPGDQCSGECVMKWVPDENNPDGGTWQFKDFYFLGTCNPGTCMKHMLVSPPAPAHKKQCSCNVGGPNWDWTTVGGIFHEMPGNYPAYASTYCDVEATTDDYGNLVSATCIGECESEGPNCTSFIFWDNVDTKTGERTRGYQCNCIH